MIRAWGSGKHVSADGTKWDLYERNLLFEYHIRYGGFGGIGYYHVSDLYMVMKVNLGTAALITSDLDQAKPLFADAPGIARRIDDRVAQLYLLEKREVEVAQLVAEGLSNKQLGVNSCVQIAGWLTSPNRGA